MRKSLSAATVLLVLFSIFLAACTAAVPEATPVAEVTQAVNELEPTATISPDRVQIYWYIGLGAGSKPEQIVLEKAFCEKYNASQNEIQLIPVVVDNAYARDNLTAQIAVGNTPDIVGPVGTLGRAAFPGAFLDLEPLIKQFNYDTSDIDPAFLDFYKDEGKLVGLPFAVFPEFTFINKDLFEEAGLNLPPQKYGEKYQWADGTEEEWTFDTMAKLAKILTVDANGYDATESGFDKTQIVQYGYVPQWTDNARPIGSLFGAWYPVNEQGEAFIPDSAIAAYKWYYEGMFGDAPFIPSQAALDSDLLKGNAFSSGKVAIATTHLWYTCCIDKTMVPNWDLAVMPSYNGKITSKMHGDTFAIMAGSKNPEAAFKVYTYMLGEGAADLYAIYGGLPARTSQQDAFFAALDETFAPNKVNWQVARDSIQYMDVPNHEMGLPNNSKAADAFTQFASGLRTNDKLDIDQAVADLIATLTGIYKEGK